MMVKNIIIVNDFDYVQGGASKVAIQTANMLIQSNKDLNVYFFSAVHNEKSTLNEKVIKICTNQTEAIKNKNKLKGFINGIYNIKAKKELKKILDTLNRDETIIHVHGWTKALSSSVFDIAFKMNFKVVLTMHDYFTACPNGGYFDYRENKICKRKPLSWQCIKCNCDSRNYLFKIYRIIRQFVQNKIVKLNDKLTAVISVSNFSENILKKTLNKNIKIYKIYNPIDLAPTLNKVDYTKNEYFLYVGRVSKEKGVDIFCEAITKTQKKGIVVGDGSELEILKKQYPNIEFVGWKSTDDVRKYIRNARCLVFPSRLYETAGLTILEAQDMFIPCIVSKNCAGSEFIDDGKNGFLFSEFDDLKEIIKKDKLKFEYKNSILNNNKDRYLKEIIEAYNDSYADMEEL